MADSDPAPQLTHGSSNALGQETNAVTHWGLDQYKDDIIALQTRTGVQMKDLPQLVEHELGIKAKPKAYRIARARWGQKRNVSTEHSMRMAGIRKKWARQGRSVEFKLSGKPYSSARLERFITYQQKNHDRCEAFWDALASYSARDIPEEISYFDPNDPDADLMALDGCLGKIGQQQSNTTTTGGDHGVMNEDQISWAAQGLSQNTSFTRLEVQCFISSDGCVIQPSDSSVAKEPGRIYTVGLKSVWHWAVAGENFLDYTTDITTHPCERAMTLYRKHFGNMPYDPSVMDELLEQLLEDDQLQEAEEVALLAVDLSESWVGQDHAESWKAKGNLASVHHEQGRYLVACQLGENVVDFFQRNGPKFDASALIFSTNLAKTLYMLGKWSEAKRLCYNVIDFSRREFGEGENTITLTAKLQLAKVCYALNEWHKAKEILEVVTTPRQQEHGFVTAKIVQAYIELAKVLQRLDLQSEALEIQSRLEAVLRNSGEPRSMWTLELVFSVGEQLYNLGHYVGAEQVFRNLVQSTAMRTKSWNHTKVVFAKTWLAGSLYGQSKEKEATAINLECLGILKEALGPYDRNTLTCMSNLACAKCNSLTWRELEAEMFEVRDLRRKHLGKSDPDTLDSEMFCAEVLRTNGRWEDALDLLREVRERSKELSEPRRLYVEWKLMKAEANFFVDRNATGDNKVAMVKQQNRLALGKKIFGETHPLALKGVHCLARSYSIMGRDDEAKKILCDGISSLSEVLGRNHPAVTWLKTRHASELAFQDQWESAEMLQRQILQIESELGEKHPYVIDATRRLARSCTQLGKISEAEDLFKRATKASQATFGPTHRVNSVLFTDYGRLMRKKGNMEDAQKLYEESWNINRMSFGRLYIGDGQQPLVEHPSTIVALENLAMTLLKLGKTRQALILYLDCLNRKCAVWGESHSKSLAARWRVIKLLRKLKMFTAGVHFDELLNITKTTKGETSVALR